MIRVDGDVRRVKVPAQDHAEVQVLVYDIMNNRQRKGFEEFLETDFFSRCQVSRAFASMPLNRIAARARCFERFPRSCFQWRPWECAKCSETSP